MINAFLFSSTWNDPDFRQLDAEQMVAWFWLMSNSERSKIGLTIVSRERFSFETKLGFGCFDGMASIMRRSVIVYDHRTMVYAVLVNFIRKQFVGGQLKSRKSMIFKGLCLDIAALPQVLREGLLERYYDHPLIINEVSEMVNGRRPSTDPQDRIGQDRIGSSSLPTDDEVFEYARLWPGEPSSGAPVMPVEWAVEWLARITARGGEGSFPANWQRAMVCAWRRDFATYGANANGHVGKNGLQKTPGMWEMKERREALRNQIAEHPANETSASYVSDSVSPEEEQELARLHRELREIEKKMASTQ